MTPYFDGSSTLVTTIVPSSPCCLWKSARSWNGYSQITSEFKTKNGESSLPSVFSASLSGPAVPRGSVSMENSMLTLYSFSYFARSVREPGYIAHPSNPAYLLQCGGHNLWPIIDRQDDISHPSSRQTLNLVLNHGLIREFYQRFGERKGLAIVRGQQYLSIVAFMLPASCWVSVVPEVVAGCHTLQRE